MTGDDRWTESRGRTCAPPDNRPTVSGEALGLARSIVSAHHGTGTLYEGRIEEVAEEIQAFAKRRVVDRDREWCRSLDIDESLGPGSAQWALDPQFAQARADEREACAQVADGDAETFIGRNIAAAIRARGEK